MMVFTFVFVLLSGLIIYILTCFAAKFITFRYVLFAIYFLILIDQAARFIISNQIRNDASFFEQALESTDFDAVSEPHNYTGCQYHKLKIGYVAKTCVGNFGWRSNGETVYPFTFWSPRSHFTSLFNSWWYYELVHTQEDVMYVTKEKSIVGTFIND